MSRLGKNAGVICRQAKIAEAKQRSKERQEPCALVGEVKSEKLNRQSATKTLGMQGFVFQCFSTSLVSGLLSISCVGRSANLQAIQHPSGVCFYKHHKITHCSAGHMVY